MAVTRGSPGVEEIVREIDRLIAEMTALRSQVSALGDSPARLDRSVREAEYFGMWADRDDMRGMTSRQWVEAQRRRQWTRQ